MRGASEKTALIFTVKIVNASKLTIGRDNNKKRIAFDIGERRKNALIFMVNIVNASKLTIGIIIKNVLHLT